MIFWLRVLNSALLCMGLFSISAQEQRERKGGTISGMIHDVDQDESIAYANVVLYSARDSSQVAGTASNSNGAFELLRVKPGAYYLRIYFIGYQIKTIGNIQLRPPDMTVELGDIALIRRTVESDEVEIVAERLPLTYQLDKKVINVGEFQTAISGSAVDVLEKVPSVNVDIDGNVSLRGSANFTVLIDGRPSVLDPSDALQHIPAGTIETIEIITNPSAKYNPDGTSGIINIVLKKNRQTGRGGLANVNVGGTERYGGDLQLDQKNSWYAATLALDYNRRTIGGNERETFETTQQNLTSTISSNGDSRRGRLSYGIRTGLDLNLSKSDLLGFGGRLGYSRFGGGTDLNYRETVAPNPPSLYTSSSDRKRAGAYYAVNSSYQHLFRPNGHQWSADVIYSRRDGDEETTNELLTLNDLMTSGQRSTEKGPNHDFRVKTDYLLGPETLRLETGYQFDLDRSTDRTRLFEYDSLQAVYVDNPVYANRTEFRRGIHSIYTIVSGKARRLSWQGGVRTEHTDREVTFGTSNRFTLQRWNVYPTIHLSQDVSETFQVMASYTRRIERPRAWYLEPFETRLDAYNVRIGNPDLKPEYIDSYEGGFQTRLGKFSLSSELYYRVTHNKVERVRSVYSEGVTLQSVQNIGKDYALGNESLLTGEVSRKVSVNVIATVYRYRVKGSLFGEPLDRKSNNWSLRAGTSIRPSKMTQVQIDGNYDSPTLSSQGRREGFFTLNGAVKVDLISRKLSATLQLRDILSTAKYEDTSQGPGYYNNRFSTRDAPIIMLNVRYVFNNHKTERQRERRREGDFDDEEF